MDGHAVAAMPQELLKISGTSCWGTCEELLLVSAVKRHGGNNWNLISEELKTRVMSFNVSPLYFSEAACKEKYDVLRGRYANSSCSSRSRNEDLGNDMHWFEELRKLRVAHLKRELKHYDGSIGILQVKIKRLKAENAEDASLSKRLRKSIANPQSNEEVHGGSSCEISVHRSVRKCLELHATPVVLVSKMNSQEPSNVRNQILPEGEQRHDATEDLPGASLAYTDVKASVNVINSSPPNSVKGNNDVEQDDGKNIAVLSISETHLSETPAVPGSPGDDLRDMDADKVGASNKHEHPGLAITGSDYRLVDELADSIILHEAGDILLHALDNDEVNVVVTDLQTGQQLPVKMDVVDDELGLVHADFGQEGMDRTLVFSADSIINMEVSKNGGSDCADTETHSKEDVVVFPILPSSQQLLSAGNVGNAEDRHAELNTFTVERIDFSKNEKDIGKLEKKQTVAIEDVYHPIFEGQNKQVHVSLPLDLTKAEVGVQLGRNILECHGDFTRSTSSSDGVLNSTRKSSHVSGSRYNSNKGLTSAILDEVVSCDQKQLLLEENIVTGDDSTLYVVKELATLGSESEEPDRYSDDMAFENLCTSKESEKIGVSAVVPIASFINSKSSVLRDSAIIILEKSDLKGSASRSSGLSYTSDVDEVSPSPERHIVIALDGPGETAPSSVNVSITPANAEDNDAYQIDTPTRSDVVCDTQATGIIEELHISAQSSRIVDSCEQKDWETPHKTPANVTDLLKEVYGTGQENSLESVSQAVQAVECSDVGSLTLVSPKTISNSKSVEHTPTVAVRVDHDAEMAEETVIDYDTQPCILERSSSRDLVLDPRDSSAGYGMEVAENIGSVPDQDTLLIDIEEIQVDPGVRRGTSDEEHLQIYLRQSSELARSASWKVEGRQSSDSCIKKSPLPTLTADPDSLVVAETDLELTVRIRQDGTDLQDASHGGEFTLPEIVVDMKLECSKKELSGVESEAEPNSPLEFLAGGLDSTMPSSHEGSDSVQDQYKNERNDRNRGRTQENGDYVDSDVDKSEAGSPLDGPYEMSPSSRRNRKEPRVSGKLFPLLEVFRNLSNHKSAIFFRGRQEDPRYSSLIRRHLDLNSVRARLDEGSYSSSSEFFRDLLLIFNNAMVYYTRGSVEFRGAKALVTEATKEMNRIFRTESLLKQDRPATRTREVKKPKASAGVAIPRKIVAPSIGADSSAKLVDTISPLTNVPDSSIRKRASSRLGIVETPTNSHSEAGAARTASANFLGGPSSSRAEEPENYRENDQEVNGRLKERKNSQKGSGSCRGKPPREELLEGILLKNAANMSFGGSKLRDVKENEASARIPAVPITEIWGKTKIELESARKREAENEKIRGSEVQGKGREVHGKGRDKIDDEDFLRKGKSLSKLRDLDVTPEKGPGGKPIPKLKDTVAARVASNSHGTVGRSFRGGRKPVTSAKEPVRSSEPEAKKRMRK